MNMSPKSRFMTALMGKVPDRIPVGNIVSVATQELMESANAWFPRAHLEPEAMVALAKTSHTILGYDTVMPVFSVVQEAAALGCQIDWGSPTQMPAVLTHPFAHRDDFSLPRNWMLSSSIQVVLKSLRILRAAMGKRVTIVGKVMGPWTLSYHLLGVEEFLVSTLIDPDRTHRSLETQKAVTIAFAREQIRAGADVICLADHATGGMISPRAYRDFLLPVHREINKELGFPTVLHCCGNTTDRLQYFSESGFRCYHFESQVKVEDAVKVLAGKMTLMGNLNNPELLLKGSVDQVREACLCAVQKGVHILSPECAAPLNTPIQNLQALVQVAESTRR
jgi:MtaA/CmuA family methyltransferase